MLEVRELSLAVQEGHDVGGLVCIEGLQLS